jgi:murein DD-endopeptidase MepM/ murein hydrolase activator NlpD
MKPPGGVYAALAAVVVGVWVAGCSARASSAARPVAASDIDRGDSGSPVPPPPGGDPASPPSDGVVHVVEPGQTLWRIARVYGVDVESLRAENGIEDASRIHTGSELKIPGADAIRDVPPYPAPLPDLDRLAEPESAVDVVLEAGTWIWPVPGGEVLSRFGDPRRARLHAGLDIRGRPGQPVVAARAGRVRYSGSTLRGYGKTIVIDHRDGTSTLYGHNSELLVREGDEVAAAQAIARLGSTGNATTDHCHFEVRRDDQPVDPLPYFDAQSSGTR